ncbi:diguanylate cyclase [Roseiconus lacunae]|uniref:diguanylate cyclase domain-containing protein n=1 Tax=Roseiconus lacunae TaxID=2605694 RepID=UPI00308C6611|nr:diguanylate cyclase [Stieleria sp. HD01]
MTHPNSLPTNGPTSLDPSVGGVQSSIAPSQYSSASPDIGGMLANLQFAAQAVSGEAGADTGQNEQTVVENRLAAVRLGVATSLYYALRAKHAATAAHGLRVALFCSSWSEAMGLESDHRDRIEVAALLHDVGKIGVPDRILRKPGKLTVDEQLAMDTCPAQSCQILRGCTGDLDLLDIVRYGGVWFDSRRDDEAPRGDALPLGARMLSIADAFDAMTTEQVYRPAMSRDGAIAELVRGSGTQFDPTLVNDFSRLLESKPEILQGTMVHRWLQQLRPEDSRDYWTGATSFSPDLPRKTRGETVRRETLFNTQLHKSLKDGVAYTDSEGSIEIWNAAMERMTGLTSDAMIGKQWSATALRMRDADRELDDQLICPLQECLDTGESVRRSMVIETPGSDPLSVHVEVAPVVGLKPGSIGTVIVIHDLSDRKNLEQRLSSLHRQTRLDPLTRVSNRAHFDETLEQMVEQTAKGGPTFSLLICDIDHFKRINDTYGHPAGDDALKVFANILKAHSRDGDLVARYGGEEFLLLAASCDNATGAKRAEVIRQALEQTAVESLDGECMTASFGVTEFQSGDSGETVLARADRALLKAKDNGRNRVIQLGLGKMSEVAAEPQRGGWFDWLTGNDESTSTVVDILMPVPIDLAIEKLRGFVSDHHAEIVNVAENQLSLKVTSRPTPGGRRRVDHKITFHVVLTLSAAQQDEMLSQNADQASFTKVHLEIKPIRNRDRRRRDLNDAAKELVASFRCYLMGELLPNRTS